METQKEKSVRSSRCGCLPNWMARELWEAFVSPISMYSMYSTFLTESTIRHLLKLINSCGVEQKQMKRLMWHIYVTPGPNFTWHVDFYNMVSVTASKGLFNILTSSQNFMLNIRNICSKKTLRGSIFFIPTLVFTPYKNYKKTFIVVQKKDICCVLLLWINLCWTKFSAWAVWFIVAVQ